MWKSSFNVALRLAIVCLILGGTCSTVSAQITKCVSTRDVIVILDNSGSIYDSSDPKPDGTDPPLNWILIRNFTATFARRFTIGSSATGSVSIKHSF